MYLYMYLFICYLFVSIFVYFSQFLCICPHLPEESPLCSPLWQYYSTDSGLDQPPTSDCLIFLQPWPTQFRCLSRKKPNFTRPNSKAWICSISLVTILSHRLPFDENQSKQPTADHIIWRPNFNARKIFVKHITLLSLTYPLQKLNTICLIQIFLIFSPLFTQSLTYFFSSWHLPLIQISRLYFLATYIEILDGVYVYFEPLLMRS